MAHDANHIDIFMGLAVLMHRTAVGVAAGRTAVSPWAQGRGVGSALIAASETFLQDCGAQR